MYLSGTDTAAGSDDPGALSQEGIGIASVYRVGGELREEGEGKGREGKPELPVSAPAETPAALKTSHIS